MGIRAFVGVVDDDASVCKALARLLRSSQMDVGTYRSADAFLRSLAERKPDCLVLDIRMPGMTGLELRQRLLGLGHRIPIVFITAHAEEIQEASAAADGVEILRKPCDGQALLDAIQRAMKTPEER